MKGNDLKKRLETLHMTNAELSVKCGVTESQVKKWVENRIEIPIYVETILDMKEIIDFFTRMRLRER